MARSAEANTRSRAASLLAALVSSQDERFTPAMGNKAVTRFTYHLVRR
jgi:hypothetical protein